MKTPGRSTDRLADRLGRLRAQSGAAERARVDTSSNPPRTGSPQGSGSTSPGLEQRLRRLGSRQGRLAPPVDDRILATRLGGELVGEGLIEIRDTCCLSVYPKAPQDQRPDIWMTELPETHDRVSRDWVFMDTETTGLAGGTGTLVFLLGLARFKGDGLETRQYLCSRIVGEREMLRRGLEWCGGAGLISYNGKSFDRPLLDTRCRMQRLSAQWQGREHLDLLHTVRRAFDSRWPDCRLQGVERRLLGLRRDDDLPGAEAPAAWLDYLRAGQAERLAGVVRHNRQDLLSLAELLPVLSRIYRHPSRWRADVLKISRAWNRAGQTDRAIELLQQGPASTDVQHELAALHRRCRNWPAARKIWETLAAQGDCRARECLAKYHEHISRDLLAAQRFARDLPEGPASRDRQKRIERKIDNELHLPLWDL